MIDSSKGVVLSDLGFGNRAWFILRNGAAVIRVEFDGKFYETAMVEQSPVGFPKEAA